MTCGTEYDTTTPSRPLVGPRKRESVPHADSRSVLEVRVSGPASDTSCRLVRRIVQLQKLFRLIALHFSQSQTST